MVNRSAMDGPVFAALVRSIEIIHTIYRRLLCLGGTIPRGLRSRAHRERERGLWDKLCSERDSIQHLQQISVMYSQALSGDYAPFLLCTDAKVNQHHSSFAPEERQEYIALFLFLSFCRTREERVKVNFRLLNWRSLQSLVFPTLATNLFSFFLCKPRRRMDA